MMVETQGSTFKYTAKLMEILVFHQEKLSMVRECLRVKPKHFLMLPLSFSVRHPPGPEIWQSTDTDT